MAQQQNPRRTPPGMPPSFQPNWSELNKAPEITTDTLSKIEENAQKQAQVRQVQQGQRQQSQTQRAPATVAPAVAPPPAAPSAPDIFPQGFNRNEKNDSIYQSMTGLLGKEDYDLLLRDAYDSNFLPYGEAMDQDQFTSYMNNQQVEENPITISTADAARGIIDLYAKYRLAKYGAKTVSPYLHIKGFGYDKTIAQNTLARRAAERTFREPVRSMGGLRVTNTRELLPGTPQTARDWADQTKGLLANRTREAQAAFDAATSTPKPPAATPATATSTGSVAATATDDALNMAGRGGRNMLNISVPVAVAAAMNFGSFMLSPLNAQASPNPNNPFEVARQEQQQRQQVNTASRLIDEISKLETREQRERRARVYWGNNKEALDYVLSEAERRGRESGIVYGVDRNQAVFRQGR